jgi:Uma2 family endonuclease
VDEYHAMIRSGELPEDTSIELIDGFLTFKDRSATGEDPMTIGDQHRVAVLKAMRLAPLVEASGAFMQSQQPVMFQPLHEPEPDVAIIRGKVEDFLDHPPTAADVLCIIEVSDSSLRNDRTVKLKVYARAGIRQYVIINLPDRVIEVYTQPTKAGRYRKRQILRSTDTLRLRVGKQKMLDVPVKQLLP